MTHKVWCVVKHQTNKLLLSANPCKQLGARSGPAFVGPDLDPNCFVTLIVFLKDFFKKFIDNNKTMKIFLSIQSIHCVGVN